MINQNSSISNQSEAKKNTQFKPNQNPGSVKPKKNIKKEYYEMKPCLIRAHNLRFIEPYEFKYQLYSKGRWVGKRLLDVLTFEFKQYDRDYFIRAINEGKLKINNKITEPDHIIKRDDFLTHLVIRKENPIIDQKLDIVFESEDFLVVDKPSSWPVHVCGGYQFNTLHRILMDEHGFTDLKVLHRLDKHTSGIVIMAKNKIAAEKFRRKLHGDNVGKTYLCRVKGNFKEEKVKVIRSIIYVDKAKGVYTDVEDSKVVDYYATDTDKVGKKYDKSGVRIKSPHDDESDDDDEKNEPKYAETDFEKIFYDEKSNTSVVFAKPRTGRTHQIRIHLRYLGFPIANDPCYGGVIYNDLKDFNNPDLIKFQQYVPEEKSEGENNTVEITNQNSEVSENSTGNINDSENNKIPEKKEEPKLSVSQIYCYKIWLHAWNYKFDEYEFETKYPEWAKEDHVIDFKFE
jgi:23S rRNA-/tRNA-specific pseudouridylate synthase